MSPLEKIVDEILHTEIPTKQFVEFVERDKEYQKAKTDKERLRIMSKISQQFSNVFNEGEYENLIKTFKARYPNQ